MRLVILLACGALVGCQEPATVYPDIAHQPIEGRFTVALDSSLARAKRPTLEPISSPVTITTLSGPLAMRAAVKPMSLRPGVFWLEVYLENKGLSALQDVTVEFTDFQPSALYDFTVDPYADPTSARVLSLARIASEGVGRLAIGLPDDGSPLSFTVRVSATTTSRQATSSTTVAVTPDGLEVWAAVADADLVAVVDSATNRRVAQVQVKGRPTSIAITPDSKQVLVTSAVGNQLSIIDRSTRVIVQQFGEADGIGREPRHVVISPDGSHAFVAAFVGDRVTSLAHTKGRFRVERSVNVGRRPMGLSVTPDSKTVLVSHFLPRGHIEANEGWVSVLQAEPLTSLKEVTIHDAFNLEQGNCFAATIPVRKERVTAEAVPTELWGFFLNPSGTEGWVPGARIAPAPITERGPLANPQLTSTFNPRPGEISAPSTFLFDVRDGPNTDRLLSPGAIERPGIQDYVRCERFQLEIEMEDRELLPANAQVNRFAAFSTFVNGLTASGHAHAVGFTRGGRRAVMVSFGSDELVVYDAVTHSPSTQRHFALSGDNPVGIAFSPDGARAYVNYDNSMHLSVVDFSAYADPNNLPQPTIVPYEYEDVRLLPVASNGVSNYEMVRHLDGVDERPRLSELTQVPLVDADPVDPTLRRGKILFSSANPDRFPTLSKSSLGACASCHPDGSNDGSIWVTMEGERRTMSLRGGVAQRGWLHSSATHRDIREFATTIVTERLGGHLSAADVTALATYVANGIPKLQSPVVDEVRAARGKALFAKQCASCHAGEKFTSGNPDPQSEFGGGAESGPQLHDLNTATADAHAALGPYFESILPEKDAELLHQVRGDRALGPMDPVQTLLDFRPRPARARGAFKAPSLVNTWDNALFFHDGRFDSLPDAVHYMNQALSLGLNAQDELDVVEYTKTL